MAWITPLASPSIPSPIQVAIANTGNANAAAQGSFASALSAQNAQNTQLGVAAASLAARYGNTNGLGYLNTGGNSIFGGSDTAEVAQSVADAAASG